MSGAVCFVYAICHVRDGVHGGPVKIGIANDPVARLRQLQTASAFKLAISACVLLDNREMARAIEKSLHLDCSECAMSGEWFDMRPEAATAEIAGAIVEHCGYRLVHVSQMREAAQ